MEIKAQLSYLHIAPRKVRLVSALIKGLDVPRAELALRHLPKRSSSPLLKFLKSAVANAKHNFNLDEKGLYIKDIRVNEGPVTKRFMARAFGRTAPIRKRTSHILLILDTRGSILRPKKRKKYVGPVIREATTEDVIQEEKKPKGHQQLQESRRKAKSADFIRRVFRRKVI